MHLWIEPVAVALLAFGVRLAGREQHLSTWLTVAAVSLAASEIINFWAAIRREKMTQDIGEDAESQGGQHIDKTATALKATRKEPVKIPRNWDDSPRDSSAISMLKPVRPPQ